jgi:hypothetical protein
MPVATCRRCKKVTHLFGDMAGKFGQGTVASLAAAYFMENSSERRQSSDPYCLDPPDSQSVFFVFSVHISIYAQLDPASMFISASPPLL